MAFQQSIDYYYTWRGMRGNETSQFLARGPGERDRPRETEFDAEVEDLGALCFRVVNGVVSLTAFLMLIVIVGYWIGWHPRAPIVAFQGIEMTEFRLGEDYDRTGVYTKVITVSGTAKIDFINPSTLYRTRVTNAAGSLVYFLDIASGKANKFVQPRKSGSVIALPISANLKPLYGAGPLLLKAIENNEVIKLNFNYEIQSEFAVLFNSFVKKFTISGTCDVLFAPGELVVLDSVCNHAGPI